ncbi:V-snare-domain-containing protein [Linnemannia elongata AG-77]|uniref:Protein transport protein BOS1 n=1 Tax=Linnemannia elongata AG-77 TaxID=1314771 RepID=A0A197JSJ7_9FUNG|nr:V-snare-domain-containing protein [Linnemannia elongata AG-77]
MNSLYNHALKQVNVLQRDLEKFQTGEDTSVALQGQITATVNAFKRSIDDYDGMAKKEMIDAKREKAFARVAKFREDYDAFNKSFAQLKSREEQLSHGRNRTQLLERRQSRMNVPVEHPYQATSASPYLQQAHAMRERDFAQRTGMHLDDMLHQGMEVLDNLYQQRTTLKSTQRKMLDAANTLGLSRNVIQLIERRSSEDKWIFYAGVCITLLALWAIVHYLT